jgi:hypothetical protein
MKYLGPETREVVKIIEFTQRELDILSAAMSMTSQNAMAKQGIETNHPELSNLWKALEAARDD